MSHQSHSCFYCQEISLFEDDYPLRLGSFTSEGIIFRCSWHSQFKCASCNNFYHFSWLYWCPKTNKTICGRCNNPTLTPVKFWKRTYTYTFFCSDCNETHYDLLYSEFRGLHPWQQSIHLQAELSQSKSTKDFVITPILSHHHPWFPIWSPETVRIGKSISLEEALAIPDNVHPIREAITSHSVGIHSPLIPESDISLSDSESRWTKNTSKWIESYSKTSDDDQGDFSRQLIIDPELSQIIGKAEGLRVLDAGCGNGYLARKLAREGAEVVGVDYSQKFIEYCILQEEQTFLGCSYYQGSLTDLSFLEDNSFDLVVSNVVFIDVVNFKLAFKEISRVLKNHGRFIWSNIHPVFGRMGHVSYRLPFDTKRNEEKLYSMVDRYFDSGGYLVSWGSLEPLWQIDRTLTEYSTALYENHFLIRRIVEPKPSLQNIQKFPAFLAFDADRIPNFIIFDCVKMENSS